MYCSNCGKQLPEDAKFCAECGRQIKDMGGEATKSDSEKWETCEIELESFLTSVSSAFLAIFGSKGEKRKLVAKAIGLQGMYIAGESEVFWENDGKLDLHLKFLINKLTGDGWVPAETKGASYWGYRFRRKVKV